MRLTSRGRKGLPAGTAVRRPRRTAVPAGNPFLPREVSLIAPITLLRCHSHPESASVLFSTLGVRVQARTGSCRSVAVPGYRKARPPRSGTGPSRWSARDLHGANRLCLRSAVALRDVELDTLALFEGAVAIRLDGGEVHEHIPTTVDRDEAVALVRVEPFDGALSHYQQLPNSGSAFGFRPCHRETRRSRSGPDVLHKSSLPSCCTDSDRTRLYNVPLGHASSYSPNPARPSSNTIHRRRPAVTDRRPEIRRPPGWPGP